ncbi:MAG: lysophospholipid acyltransferase family protein [Candidatus Acidiferrales bacterium]
MVGSTSGPARVSVLYYTAVDTDAKSAAPASAPNATSPFDLRVPQLSRWRRMQIPVIAWLVYGAIRLIGPTLRLDVIGSRNAALIEHGGEVAIGAFWHRCIFSAAWIWRNRGLVVMNTVNFDGQWTRRVIERLGFGTAQGSSSRGAIEGLSVMAQRLKEGKHVAFTIDGPRGPRYVAKPGPVILSRRTGSPITCFPIGLERAYTFKKSWDLFQIPIPFSRAVMFFAPLVRVPTDASSDFLHQKQAEMQAALEKVRDAAESWFQLSDQQRKEVRATWNRRD